MTAWSLGTKRCSVSVRGRGRETLTVRVRDIAWEKVRVTVHTGFGSAANRVRRRFRENVRFPSGKSVSSHGRVSFRVKFREKPE